MSRKICIHRSIMTDMSSYWLEPAYILCRVLALVAFGILGMNVSTNPLSAFGTVRIRQ